MKSLKWSVTAVAAAILIAAGIQAQDGKEVTLKGNITCAKCDLKIEKGCKTVLDVKEGAAKGVYYFDAAGHKKFHKDVCQASKAGSVTGVVGEDKAKKTKTIKVSEVKYD
jgi:hypothetical protein